MNLWQTQGQRVMGHGDRRAQEPAWQVTIAQGQCLPTSRWRPLCWRVTGHLRTPLTQVSLRWHTPLSLQQNTGGGTRPMFQVHVAVDTPVFKPWGRILHGEMLSRVGTVTSSVKVTLRSAYSLGARSGRWVLHAV